MTQRLLTLAARTLLVVLFETGLIGPFEREQHDKLKPRRRVQRPAA